jgi:predicted enzyme related to lactoylglutathione lyase
MSISYKSSRDIIVRTQDFAAAKSFYEKVMRLSTTYASENLVGYESGSFRLYVEQGKDHGPVFEFKVSDFAAARAALLKAGCELLEEDPKVPRCYLKDPYGLVFNIEQA